MATIYAQELKIYRSSIITWTISLSLLVALFLSLFPAFDSDVSSSMKLLANLPLAVREALGISLSDFFTIFGFYSYLFTFVTLAGGIQAMNIGLSGVGKEFAGNTADFLLTKPVSRNTVLTQKLLAGLTALCITNLLFGVVAFFAALAASKQTFSFVTFSLLTLVLFLVQLLFFALGVLLAVSMRKIKSVVAVSLPITFGFFIVGSLGAIIGSTIMRYLTPFKFYDPTYIIQHQSYEVRYVLLELVLVVALIAASYVIFNKKEVPTA